ncbi:hypothetical protein PEX1_074740 [Penicillium expansum]|uniref:Uncharacterized protein n=1 Tax=Penicillium expansum TaxID=27334 RepID=A0A0A2INK7_PENEN|nr:hypothetical protein PEX2_107050 [Penicillium expansum]KGO41825.1 hypothetical protein PEXP_108310 [Penicillium expansum]KGO51180.1 hypothetical protein PEX2_107050 [Penicillium expansum]KGO73661.1 hypothetical protein PEX1_074740 [Penicillium expansum]
MCGTRPTKSGGWNVTPRSSTNVPFSMSLALAYKLGSISPSALGACKGILDAVPPLRLLPLPQHQRAVFMPSLGEGRSD